MHVFSSSASPDPPTARIHTFVKTRERTANAMEARKPDPKRDTILLKATCAKTLLRANAIFIPHKKHRALDDVNIKHFARREPPRTAS